MTVDQQITNLLDKGLIIGDQGYARYLLTNVSYFRLIKAFSRGLKVRNGNYHANVRFEDIVSLYDFNEKLRRLIFVEVERVEITLRCRLSGHFCDTYGILGYMVANNFNVTGDVFVSFHDDIKMEIMRNSRSPFVRNFRSNYIDGNVPLYALVELMSFGTLSKFYKNMKTLDKKIVSKMFGVGYSYFESWIESISYVRNICAHYGRLYNSKLVKSPRLYSQYADIDNRRVFATLLTLKYLLPNDKKWFIFVQAIENLLVEHPNVNLNLIGFPQNWSELLLQ
jgi:abortive infection bacteriophage resistance protein